MPERINCNAYKHRVKINLGACTTNRSVKFLRDIGITVIVSGQTHRLTVICNWHDERRRVLEKLLNTNTNALRSGPSGWD